MTFDWSWSGEEAFRLLLATLLGGLIGFNRELADKPAGLRTHMLVALGSATLALVGLDVGPPVSSEEGEVGDPTRILQGVVGGIGFMGAGAILQRGDRVSGLTTAASVWLAGALGVAAGVGAYVLVTATALLAFIILSAVSRFETWVRAKVPELPQTPRSETGPTDDGSDDKSPQPRR